MGRSTAILWAALVLAPAILPVAGQAQQREALVPVQVAIDALPGAVRIAIQQSQEELLTDVGMHRLEVTYAYVQGFADLPAGRDALSDEVVRASYAWAESAVETSLGIPPRLESLEAAAAACEAQNEGVPQAEVRRLLVAGVAALGEMKAIYAELESLNETAPTNIAAGPFRETVALLKEWLQTRGKDAESCLDALALEVGDPPASGEPLLTAIVIPAATYPGGRYRVLGTWTGPGGVQVHGPGLGLDASLQPDAGRWLTRASVPRTAVPGAHAIAVTAGDQRVDLELGVERFPVDLRIEAPRLVNAGATFLVRVQATSRAPLPEVDRADVALGWRGQAPSVDLLSGLGAARLSAGAPGTFLLEARYPGTEALLPAYASVEVVVEDPGTRAQRGGTGDAGSGFGVFGTGRAGSGLFGDGCTLFLGFCIDWLLVLLLLVLVSVAAWRLVRRLRREPRTAPQPPQRVVTEADWMGSRSFAYAIGLLFETLRRLRLVPPGRTVREWSSAGHAHPRIAEAFEHVRYGGRAEPSTLRQRGTAWVKRLWERLP